MHVDAKRFYMKIGMEWIQNNSKVYVVDIFLTLRLCETAMQ